jgi:hypothetical protein
MLCAFSMAREDFPGKQHPECFRDWRMQSKRPGTTTRIGKGEIERQCGTPTPTKVGPQPICGRKMDSW